MEPPSGVNFLAFESRFSRIWLMRRGSPTSFSSSMPDSATLKCCPCDSVWGYMMETMESIRLGRSNSSWWTASFPLSILDMSKTSLSSDMRCLEEKLILWRQSATRPWFWIWAAAMVAIPMMAFMGVRISWLMRERKSRLAVLACCALASASLSVCRVFTSWVRSDRDTTYRMVPAFSFTGYR